MERIHPSEYSGRMEETKLEKARRRVAEGRANIDQQKSRIEGLIVLGASTVDQERALASLEDSQRIFEEHLAGLEAKTASPRKSPGE